MSVTTEEPTLVTWDDLGWCRDVGGREGPERGFCGGDPPAVSSSMFFFDGEN